MTLLHKITFQGNLPAGDAFQHGFYCLTPNATAMSAVVTAADAALTAMFAAPGNLGTFYRAETIWSATRVDRISTADGSTVDSLNGTATVAGTQAGGQNLPGEVACCVTLRSDTLTASGRGRSYMPAPATTSLMIVGRFTTSFQAAVIAGWKQAFASMAASAVTAQPVVWSSKLKLTYPITSIECGDVPDAQRRRRNALTEGRSSLAFP